MATVLDVDEKMPPVAAPTKTPEEYSSRVTRSVPPKKPTRWIHPKNQVAVEVLTELAEIYTDQAEFIEAKSSRKNQSAPDRMVSGYYTAAAASDNPIEFLFDRISNLTYALNELRAGMTEIMNEEQARERKGK